MVKIGIRGIKCSVLSGAAARTGDLKEKNIIKVFIKGKLVPVKKNNNTVIAESSNEIEYIRNKHLLNNCK